MWEYNNSSYLCHYGIPGMKWGKHIAKRTKSDIMKSYSNPKNYKTVKLNKKEFWHVMSELITNITDEQKKKDVIMKPIGDHVYSFENTHDGMYRVIGKKKILPNSKKR